MDYLLTEEQKMIQNLAREIAQEKIKPKRAYYDETEEFPWDLVKIMAQSDMFGIYIEEKYGGMGFKIFELCLAIEELSKVCGGISLALAASALGTFPIILFGNEQQKQKYLPSLARGEKLAAFGLTESQSGSDAASIRTQATKDGDFYILNGTKQWITNGGEAEIYTIIAITDSHKGARGASAFIVEKGTKGFDFGKKEKKLGIRASATRELIFTDCRIPKENLLGREGMGFIVAMKTFDATRPGVAAQALGIAEGAFEEALEYAHKRKQFGHPISSFQAIQHMLADMATQIEAARALTYSTARMIDAGKAEGSKESAMAKLMASDVAMKVTIDAIQIFGGYGYMKDYPVEKMMRDAKITQIYEGTNQIQRNVIALELVRELSRRGI
ncbi:MAG TPA: acyl-CoA dehydrogenase family protein [bacterium]|nr:acyl-CoA dehydrogenase family protein [bacterium]